MIKSIVLASLLLVGASDSGAAEIDRAKALYLAGQLEEAFPLYPAMMGQHNLGVAYANGQGVQRDMAKAVANFESAANQGYGPRRFRRGGQARAQRRL